MRNTLADLPFFVEVARHKSFSRAADALDIPIATLSRRIAAMEKDLGVLLFRRTTRSVELTEEGAVYYKSCELIVAEADTARETLLSGQKIPRGRVRLSLPPIIYHLYMHGSLSAFTAAYPEIDLHVHFSSQWVDLNTDHFDLEIRVGSLPDSSLKHRKLLTVEPGFYASPAFLERYPLPQTPTDLRKLPCTPLATTQGHLLTLSKGRKTETFNVPDARHTVNSTALSLEFALAGQTIAGLGVHIAEKYVASGQLVRLLPDWRAQGVDISLVMPPISQPYRVRLLIDHLAAHFASVAR